MTDLLPQTELVKTKQQIMVMLPPLRARVAGLAVMTDEDYQRADALLSEIMTSKRFWLHGSNEPGSKWKGIDAIIRPFREGLDGLYDLKNEGLKPHEQMEADVKSKMKTFKQAEAIRIQEEERQKRLAIAKLQQEIIDKAAKVEAAKAPKMREKLITQQMELETKQKDVARPTAAPVKAARSSSRTVKSPHVTDFLAFITGIVALQDDGIPLDLLGVNTTKLLELYRSDPDLVAQLPGVEIKEEIVIAGR